MDLYSGFHYNEDGIVPIFQCWVRYSRFLYNGDGYVSRRTNVKAVIMRFTITIPTITAILPNDGFVIMGVTITMARLLLAVGSVIMGPSIKRLTLIPGGAISSSL